MNMEIFTKLVGNASYAEDNIVWFIGLYYSAIFRLDTTTGECKLFAELISDHRMTNYRYFNCCMKHGEHILAFPCYSNENIKVVNIMDHTIIEIEINNGDNRKIGIMGVYKDGRKCYAVALGIGEILEIDTVSLRISNRYFFGEEINDIRGNCYFHERKIYIYWERSNKILEFDIPSKSIRKYAVAMMDGIYTFGILGDNVCLASKNKELYLWNKEKNEIVDTKALPDGFGYYIKGNDEKYYLDTEYSIGMTLDYIEINNKVWLIPHEGNYIMRIMSGEINTLELFENEENHIIQIDFFFNAKKHAMKYSVLYIRSNRYIGLFSFLSNSVYEIDSQNDTIEKININLDEKSDKIIRNRYYLFALETRGEKGKDDLELMLSVELDEYYAKRKELEEFFVQSRENCTVGSKIMKLVMK